MSEVTNPHDRFFRDTLSRPGAARAFLQHVLPAEVKGVLDVSEPEMVQDSFVDADLRAHRADLLYRVQLRDGRGAYAYVLFEHKSTPDRWVAFQLLRYLPQAAPHREAEDLQEAIKMAFPEEGDVLMSTVAQKWIEQGQQQGLQQGLEQGKQEGIKEGVREGLLAGIEVSLEIKFGEEGLRLLPEIYKIEDVDVLRAVQKAIKTAEVAEDLRRIYR